MMSNRMLFLVSLLAMLTAAWPAGAATLQVGSGKTYAAPCAAAAAAADGDVIEIDAGLYSGDVCSWYPSNLTIRGIGGYAHLDAAGEDAEGKAIWVIKGDNIVIEYIEFTGASVPDQNGAGIRAEGSGLTLRHCWFHDNEEGILGGAGEVVIEYCEFGNNGYGDGYSHNMYLSNSVTSFTLRFSYTHHAIIGHNVKSRAQVNYILYNLITDEDDGTASYEIDLPNGGTSFVIGNVVQQGPATDNSTILTFAEEGGTNPSQDLYVVNNTFVNDRDGGTFIRNSASTPAVVVNNIFAGTGTVLNGPGDTTSNLPTADAGFVDRAAYDYHLAAGSAAINAGVDPGSGGGMSLAPAFEYVHPASGTERTVVDGVIDMGAFEFGNAPPVDDGVPENIDDIVEIPDIPDAADDAAPDAPDDGVQPDTTVDTGTDTLPPEGGPDADAGEEGEGGGDEGCGCTIVA
jgi:hypothetical protein